jgi:uncharacterized protein (TIGR02145 family)
LPSGKEWDDLNQVVGGIRKIYNEGSEMGDEEFKWVGTGKKLKAASGWEEKGNGTDEFGFSALPGGYRYTNGEFRFVEGLGLWWTVTESGSIGAYSRLMDSGSDEVTEGASEVGNAYSVRCIAD